MVVFLALFVLRLPVHLHIGSHQLLAAVAVPLTCRGNIAPQTGVTVCVAVRVFAEIALQQAFEVIIPAADIAGVFFVLKLLVEVGVFDGDEPPVATNVVIVGSAVRTSVVKLGRFCDAG